MRTNVSETLDRHLGVFWQSAKSLEQFEGQDTAATTGRFFTTFGPIVLDRLASNTGRIEAMLFFPLVSNPSHGFRIRPHVRCRNVFVGPNDFMYLVDELSADALSFLDR